MKRYLYGAVIVLLALAGFPAKATHIVGGEVSYTFKGLTAKGELIYQIRVDYYQDCLTGDPNAIGQDNPLILVIFDGTGKQIKTDSIWWSQLPTRVPVNFSNSCINNPPPTCLNKASFIKEYILKPSPTGYFVVNQRCCRNFSVTNLVAPGATGATYFCRIPPPSVVMFNNSAVFKNYPPQIICINNPLFYDHSASDADGDSLTYEFCTALRGGSDQDAKPTPTNINFQPVQYAQNYSAVKPMNGYPQLQINTTTGQITGTPNQIGRFVVTVCCNEWRNGVLINTVKRDFQFVVTSCSKAVVANIPQYSQEFNTYIVQCKSKSVFFKNLSTGGFAYSWDFGVPGDNSDTSSAFEPTFTYPDTGTFLVKLVVNRGSTCPDSISRWVKVYPEFHTDWSVTGLHCPNTPLQFTDLSSSTYQPINYWAWTFDDGATSSDRNPVHAYTDGGMYNVQLISRNYKGCTDTVVKAVEIEKFRPFAGNDTIIVKGERIYFRASGGNQYTWTPPTWLDNPAINNPIGYYPDTTRITYNVHIKSEFGCEGDDSIRVWVVNQASIFVPSAFTPNGDGRNDYLKPIGIGYRDINYFRVFNRWGEQVFYTLYFGEGWDGTSRGRPADIGTYFWELSMTDRFGNDETMKGDATLLR